MTSFTFSCTHDNGSTITHVFEAELLSELQEHVHDFALGCGFAFPEAEPIESPDIKSYFDLIMGDDVIDPQSPPSPNVWMWDDQF